LLATMEEANKIGDAMYEDFTRQVHCASLSHQGHDLRLLRDAVASSRDVGRRSDIRDTALVIDTFGWYAAAWMKPDVADFEREAAAMSEERLFGDLAPTQAMMARFFYFLVRADLSWLRGDVAAARVALARTGAVKGAAFGSPNLVELYLLSALIAARGATEGPWFLRARALPKLWGAVRSLQAWADACPANFEPHALIARAELQRVLGRTRTAAATYDRAIESAARCGAAKREGIACELAAANARARGDATAAASHLQRAIDAYGRWGAVAKVKMLEGASGSG
jgi:hypothetical protein